jgi:gas vesicle protein
MHHRNHDDEEEQTGDATEWSAFLTGALIGAGVALLFAPQAGTELRGRLRDYANRAKEDLTHKGPDAWDTVVERGKEFYEKGEEVIRDTGRSAREFAKQEAKQGREAVKDAGRAAKEVAQRS